MFQKKKQKQSKSQPCDSSKLECSLAKVREHLTSHPVVHFKGAKSDSPLRITTDNKGRFVRFSLQAEVSFHLDTIEIFNKAGRNIAPNKRTIISSCYDDDDKYDGRGALVGKKNGGCGFHTKRERNPWLVVDLGTIRNLAEVIVYNREGNFYTRALSLKIESSRDLHEWQPIYDNWECLKAGDAEGFSEQEQALLFAGVLEADPVRKLLKRYKSEGDLKRAANLLELTNELVKDKGFALAPQHGFTRPFDLSSEKEKNKTYKELAQVLQWLNEDYGIPAFISSGTLLGIVREGKFIGHDDDVDICYVSSKTTEQEILSERLEIMAFLQSKGCKTAPSGIAHYWCTTPHGVSMDIFSGFMEDGFCSMNPISRKEVVVESVLPLKTQVVKGVTLYLPQDPEPLLVLNYGPSWRTPDPLWSFDWGKAKRDFKFLYF
ncbi:discoidin domain-containing protein [Neiella marina]|uniref:Discoidin domain-containing protein n=1 Tax=Neiella holothuriorum TaxID=2870530 RepID=A0ABS7EEI0_9GAMM|nr:discoidin domain-containing protein [Neiella holothuriorum]MBW8190742.1 discoidin domain-containing protein [Neiella holothuriorum]